jgi:hypothetical protein
LSTPEFHSINKLSKYVLVSLSTSYISKNLALKISISLLEILPLLLYLTISFSNLLILFFLKIDFFQSLSLINGKAIFL